MHTYERRFEKLPEDQKLSKLCSEASLNLVGAKNQIFMPRIHVTSSEKENCAKGWKESDARFGFVSDLKICKTHGRCSVEV